MIIIDCAYVCGDLCVVCSRGANIMLSSLAVFVACVWIDCRWSAGAQLHIDETSVALLGVDPSHILFRSLCLVQKSHIITLPADM